MTPASMWTLSLSTSLRALVSVVAGFPSLSSSTTSTFRPAICQPVSCQYSSHPAYISFPAAAIAPDSGDRNPILIGPCAPALPTPSSDTTTAITATHAPLTMRTPHPPRDAWSVVLTDDRGVAGAAKTKRGNKAVRAPSRDPSWSGSPGVPRAPAAARLARWRGQAPGEDAALLPPNAEAIVPTVRVVAGAIVLVVTVFIVALVLHLARGAVGDP